MNINKKGRKIFTGDPKALKESQGYTPEFGMAVYDAFAPSRPTANHFSFDSDSDYEMTEDDWPDVEGEPLCTVLRVPYRSPW